MLIARLQPFQSTPPSRGVTTVYSLDDVGVGISIHTPLAGSDAVGDNAARAIAFITIHTPLAGSDVSILSFTYPREAFQSTLPSRGVTAIPHSIMQIFPHAHVGIAQSIPFPSLTVLSPNLFSA